MKRNIRLLFLMALIIPGISAFSQKYKDIEDTSKLNKEYLNLSNDIIDLKAKLAIAKNNLPNYQLKAKDANTDAVNAAAISNKEASKATNGNIHDAKTAKRKASKAYREAKDSKSADGKVNSKENTITRYQLDIQKKQDRLDKLAIMRLAINAKIEAASALKKN